jgi:hypothetical protein
MAKTMLLSEAARADIAARIGSAVVPVFSSVDGLQAELTETFEVWRFKGIVESADVSFESRVSFSRRYHHQLRVNGMVNGHAITTRPEGDDAPWRVMRLGPSGLAAEIDATLDEIENAAPDDGTTVRLLEAPEYILTAFWLVQPGYERLYVVGCPPYFRFIPRRTFLTPEGFVAALAEEQLKGAPTDH